MSKFAHLSVFSEFSLDQGMDSPKKLALKAKEKGVGAMALTDKNFMPAGVKQQKLFSAQGVKPIHGCFLKVITAKGNTFGMTAIAENEAGYRNLVKLVSGAFEQRDEAEVPDLAEGEYEFHDSVVVKESDLIAAKDGITVLSGSILGDLGQLIKEGRNEVAVQRAKYWKNQFGDRYFIELTRAGRPGEDVYVAQATRIAAELGIPVVATNQVLFSEKEDFEAHLARMAIARKQSIEKVRADSLYTVSPHQYLKTPEQMAELFADIPVAIENANALAQRANVVLELGTNHLPKFPTTNRESEAEFLRSEAQAGLEARLQKLFGERWREHLPEYQERLDYEIGIINRMEFPGYFLIVADFVQWAKNNDIPVGPGRGSGAGSLVAYSLKITDLDPMAYGLMFERFLNPERVSMPDFDVDFCNEGRDKVIDYVASRYGRNAVSQIITFGSMAAKSAIKDAARVNGLSYHVAEALAKCVPDELGATMADAEQAEGNLPVLLMDPEVAKAWDTAKRLEGTVRQVGKHAGGVLISPSSLVDFTATYKAEGDDGEGKLRTVSQFDKDDVEEAGLVKFDFLGLKTLTIIKHALKNIESNKNLKVDLEAIDFADEKSFNEIFVPAKTSGVFQLESKGMKDLIKKLKPENFKDIIALLALFRPGPMDAGMVDLYCDVKNGIRDLELPHPRLAEVLKDTYGVFLYQEQIMSAAQVLAGYTLGQADELRRAMGKKKPEEMAKQHAGFLEGCEKNGVSRADAERIFSSIEKFAGYAFNLSHSAGYAVLSMQTAWLKAHHPSEFMAAVISNDANDLVKTRENIREAESLNLEVLRPDINESKRDFSAVSDTTIRFGLRGIKGVGDKEIEKILSEREARGPFSTFESFVQRCNPGKAVIVGGIRSGLFDGFGIGRATLEANFEDVRKAVKGKTKKNENLSLMGEAAEAFDYKKVDDHNLMTTLSNEKESIGVYLSGHPMKAYEAEKESVSTLSFLDYQHPPEDAFMKQKAGTVVGLIDGLSIRKKRGKSETMASFRLDDGDHEIEAFVRPEIYESISQFMVDGKAAIFEGRLRWDSRKEQYRFVVDDCKSVEESREVNISHVEITIQRNVPGATTKEEAMEYVRSQARGGCGVMLVFQDETRRIPVRLDSSFNLYANQSTVDAMVRNYGGQVSVVYRGDPRCDAFNALKPQIDHNEREQRAKRCFERAMELLECP